MEESYETFEEELGRTKPETPPQKLKRRPVQGETSPASQQPKQVATRHPRISRTSSVQKPTTTETVPQTDTPWENVTLNRCLFVAITILVITSGLQRLHETLRGHRTVEEVELTVGHSRSLRHRPRLPQPDTLWEVIFWWVPDLRDDDEEDDDDDDDNGDDDNDDDDRQGKPKMSSSIKRKPRLDKLLTKERGIKIKERRAKKAKAEGMESKEKRGRPSKHKEADEEDENEENEEVELPKTKTQKG